MKIELLEGCDYSMEVDGTEFVDLSRDKQKEVCYKLIDKADEAILQSFLENICHSIGKIEDLGYCETCGEYNNRYTIDI